MIDAIFLLRESVIDFSLCRFNIVSSRYRVRCLEIVEYFLEQLHVQEDFPLFRKLFTRHFVNLILSLF